MSLFDYIPNVITNTDEIRGNHIYVVCNVTEGVNGHAKTKTVFCAKSKNIFSTYNDLFLWFKTKYCHDLTCNYIGGGQIKIDNKQKAIGISDLSKEHFGLNNSDIDKFFVREMLAKAFPSFEINLI